MTRSESKEFDWGDGHRVKVKRPNLKHLPDTHCVPDCHPFGGTQEGEVWHPGLPQPKAPPRPGPKRHR